MIETDARAHLPYGQNALVWLKALGVLETVPPGVRLRPGSPGAAHPGLHA